MFATTRRTQDARTKSGHEGPWSEECATETWNDAQICDNSLSLSRQFWSRSKIAEERIRSWPRFFVLWQVIGVISAYDAFLAMKYRDELPYIESNFIGQLLLLVNGDDPAVFLGVKFLGTIMVLGILANLYHTRPRWAMSVAYGVAGFQVGLWAYLNWA